MSYYQYRKSHCGDKTILRPSYLHNGISFTGKATSLYWIGAQDTCVLVKNTCVCKWLTHKYLFWHSMMNRGSLVNCLIIDMKSKKLVCAVNTDIRLYNNIVDLMQELRLERQGYLKVLYIYIYIFYIWVVMVVAVMVVVVGGGGGGRQTSDHCTLQSFYNTSLLPIKDRSIFVIFWKFDKVGLIERGWLWFTLAKHWITRWLSAIHVVRLCAMCVSGISKSAPPNHLDTFNLTVTRLNV